MQAAVLLEAEKGEKVKLPKKKKLLISIYIKLKKKRNLNLILFFKKTHKALLERDKELLAEAAAQAEREAKAMATKAALEIEDAKVENFKF